MGEAEAVMRFGSVCSGIEAASAAWHPLGWEAAWFSEIEPFPCAVLAHHYPEVPNHGDMTKLPQLIRSGEVEAPDLFCGGTPCQAFSVAGLRRSLDDARGNLSLTFCEIADAIDAVRRAGGKPASIVFWENVPGVLSTSDNAFGCFLGALAGCDTAIEPLAATGWTDAGVVAGPVRSIAWRVLDAQYFGLAQRRRRVFVVASAREDFDPAAVLLEWEGVRRDSAPSREAGKDAPTIPSRSTAGGGLGTDFDCDGGVIQHCGFCKDFFAKYRCNAPDECDCPRCQGMCGCYSTPASTYCIKGAAIGRKPEAGPQHGEVLEEACYTLNCVDQHAVAQPYTLAIRGRGDSHNLEYRQDGTANALLTPNGGRGGIGVGAIAHAFDARQSDVIQYGDKTGPLDTDGHSVAVALAVPMVNMQGSKGNAVAQADGPSFTLNAMHGHDVHAVLAPTLTASNDPSRSPQSSEITAQVAAVVQATAVAFTQNQRDELRTLDVAGALAAEPGMKQQTYLQTAMQVRRLTPRECERLQGFPDGYTAIPWRGKAADQCPDGPRYKALGNSWAVPVVRWIGERINAVTAAPKSAPQTRGSNGSSAS